VDLAIISCHLNHTKNLDDDDDGDDGRLKDTILELFLPRDGTLARGDATVGLRRPYVCPSVRPFFHVSCNTSKIFHSQIA